MPLPERGPLTVQEWRPANDIETRELKSRQNTWFEYAQSKIKKYSESTKLTLATRKELEGLCKVRDCRGRKINDEILLNNIDLLLNPLAIFLQERLSSSGKTIGEKLLKLVNKYPIDLTQKASSYLL